MEVSLCGNNYQESSPFSPRMKRLSPYAIYGERFIVSYVHPMEDKNKDATTPSYDWGDNVYHNTDDGLRLFFVKTPKSTDLTFEELIPGAKAAKNKDGKIVFIEFKTDQLLCHILIPQMCLRKDHQ